MPDEQAAGAAAEEEEEDRDCPVCLEDTRYLPGLPVTIPCCRKVYCRPCIIALVGAHKGSAPVGADGVAKSMAHTLICPTCRAEHHVPGGRGEQWACKLALDSDPSKWGGTDARSALLAGRGRTPRSVRKPSRHGLDDDVAAAPDAAGGAMPHRR